MAFCPACALVWVGVATVIYFLYSKFVKSHHDPRLRKEDWKKDTVYLFQFHRPKGLPSLSPFCVKLEMLFRLNNIPYENVFISSARSKYGLVPFVEFNGKHYGDSHLIETMILEHFNIKPLPNSQEEAYAQALARMVENHLFYVMLNYKVLTNLTVFATTVLHSIKINPLVIPIIRPLFQLIFRRKVENRIFTALGPFSDADFLKLLRKDLNTLRDALGKKQYLMGDEPHAVDCTVFGHLATVCLLKTPNEVTKIVSSEYPTLQDYQKRIIAKFFSAEFE